MRIGAIRIPISRCTTGVYLRWWFNGWHYFNFVNGYEITMKTESMGTQTTRFFSVISKVERPTRLKAEYSYLITVEGIAPRNIGGFTGLILAEKVEQYEDGVWREVEVIRGNHLIRDAGEQGFEITFTVTRKELPDSSSVYQKALRLYLDDTLCDMDDNEVVPINKQTNDIAEMQDRQSDFTAQFRVRKTRAMKGLFQLSGEPGISSDFPFATHECKLVSDNIEIITGGTMIIEKNDDEYYYTSILSGNKNFFKTIELLKITDLLLPTTNHTWNVATMVATHAGNPDYVYPLCEPSDDAKLLSPTDTGDRVDCYGGWIWPFIKVEAIWKEIFANAGYTVTGDILTNPHFLRMFLPIVNRNSPISHIATYNDSIRWSGRRDYTEVLNQLTGGLGTVLLFGLPSFRDLGIYTVRVTGLHKFRIGLNHAYDDGRPEPGCWVYALGIPVATLQSTYPGSRIFVGEYAAVSGDLLKFYIGPFYNCIAYSIAITDIEIDQIDYGTAVTPRLNLPDLSQTDFIKMICNIFGLIPDVTPRDRTIKFWNYDDLYNNIALARDWSAYLSERDDENEFKFGEYAQDNYLRYRESEDVLIDEGMGSMQIDDETLPAEKDVVELPVSTTDEVTILDDVFSVDVSRIAFNEYDIDDAVYKGNKSIDPRIVYIDFCKSVASPPYVKTFGISAVVGGATTDIDTPKIASSHEIWFSAMVTNYASLSRLLTKTNLRRAKFNLPVYEVAGLKHYIPVYLRQYKAYFYVNKINNYVPGQLCTIDLIKL